MRKKAVLLFLLFCFIGFGQAFAYEKSTDHPLVRPAAVFTRGAVNLLTIPSELVTTGIREVGMHSRLWPVTYLPRVFTNLASRLISSINDIAFYPIYAAWTDDVRPWTDPMGLPDYGWQVE